MLGHHVNKTGRFGVGSTIAALTTNDHWRVKMATYPVRPIRIVGNVAYVPLTKGYEAGIDATDAQLVEGFNWQARVDKHDVYAQRISQRDGVRTCVKMHRVITSAPHGSEVDHADGDGLNNRKSNLRICTTTENRWNRLASSVNTSGYKGVTWAANRGKWTTAIKFHHKTINLGRFDCPKEAHAAYAAACVKYHGDFARLS
jgi:hypothetical protein